jgi:hypothetical protein
MGFFSWNTADTQESIANSHSEHENANRTIYLLQPNGLDSIVEREYEGYGMFNNTDAYVWLGVNNFEDEILDAILTCSDNEEDFLDKVRSLAISVNLGHYFEDINTGETFAYNDSQYFEGMQPFNGSYADVMDNYGKTPNELVKEGIWVEKSFTEMITINNPLKFSYDKDAVYEDLPASTDCRFQGFFYEDNEEGEF